ncbi:MAG: 2-C-methyl-D-erythritol 4-phosphate cytidylyltransferase [Pseudomonadales bacterium]|jgi:2-C-methyl-D-erythritol 4-phosphate cytidylyltransferase|uniref:2-C-methyl-D-erythritol 4-phosphate cytidylyltransferase n=1 Tax=unclassified Ketobacter TaxID=2639109 RepID=UPI000C3C403F|nr:MULTISPECIES: 2-C-methyl-D-erythritol 4-phosphate cytidylyltransferase [unclassified Ketobacter]MAA59905.1 2-C-methyl-D-erythritol 4-phosphate cytidylyltransferase [Pseudomonadales bacterium]MEC8814142.1 2-C-methyl-D-erythritol 4-phosphate cytidylyltransferase [Pseudomonadota bacterium]TNC84439.1 MAG: 2-C-methyl-D-erythritol 4-phosphate cytidylyltransferase [Alcanivorax sp.]HAU12729.1 2-C-methyl-D-erythritol 4-phosphate cytidylyltransferase [Gammaproteobacteria bacterium]MAQ25040.1 2-C-meth
MNASTRIWCVVPAAGVGKRFGSAMPKQYLQLNGKTVVENTLERLLSLSEISQVVVAISAEDNHFKSLKIARDSRIKTVIGGAERCHSVLNGLRYVTELGSDQDWVLVHDVARPCVRADDVRKLIRQVEQFDAVGGILANQVRDTMKRGNRINQIEATVDRSQLWHALTPQLFRLGDLRRAIESALDEGLLVTDESAAMERLGHHPLLVEGMHDNIKITHPLDLALTELYIQRQ